LRRDQTIKQAELIETEESGDRVAAIRSIFGYRSKIRATERHNNKAKLRYSVVVRESLPPYWFFEQYQEAVLDELTRSEALLRLDDEVANKQLLPRYQGPVDDNEWDALERYYSTLFSDFVIDRIEGLVDTTPIEIHRERFHEFRKDILRINKALPGTASEAAVTIPKPAELLLLKQLRERRYDPADLDITYLDQGGPLYLLELFVTAARQQANQDFEPDGGAIAEPEAGGSDLGGKDESLVEALIEEAQSLGSSEPSEVKEYLITPILMVTLWENQREGLNEWLDSGQEGILEMATATGKTVVGIATIAHLCGELPDHPDLEPLTNDAQIMVVAHSNAILNQWQRELNEKLGLSGSELRGDGQPDNLHFATGTVEFRTAHSLLPRYDPDLAQKYDLIIYDEVHHYSNEEGFGQAISRPNYEASLGLSATVGEEDGDPRRKALEDLLAPVIYTYDLNDAIEDEIIPQFEWTVHPTSFDASEREEWRQSTESITNQFTALKHSQSTRQILETLSVPFNELEDLGDFVQAHRAAGYELDRDLPDAWSNLHKAISSRSWIRHRSQPKIKSAVDLAKDYLTEGDGMKIVMFAMDIDTTERLHSELSEHTDNAYVVHSQVASSNRKKDRIVNRRIQKFSNANHGVLIAPKLLDEGIDVPDAEIGINVAGTKTKLQLVQRMGRVLRKHGDQKPRFHHFVAIPDEHYVHGVDSKAYVQELNWIRELGELIRQQPEFERADVDQDILDRAEARGHELWAQDLLADREIETVQGSVRLEEVLGALTIKAVKILLSEVDFSGDIVGKDDWQAALSGLRSEHSVSDLQQIWWLFPLYRDRPGELEDLLSASLEKLGGDVEDLELSEKPYELDTTSTDDVLRSQDNTSLPDETPLREFFEDISGVGRVTHVRLQEIGIETVGDLRSSTEDEIVEADYVGPNTAEKLLNHLEKHSLEGQTAGHQEDAPEIPDETPIEDFFEDIPDIGRVTHVRLREVGFETLGDLRTADREEMLEADYVGPVTIDKILEHLYPEK